MHPWPAAASAADRDAVLSRPETGLRLHLKGPDFRVPQAQLAELVPCMAAKWGMVSCMGLVSPDSHLCCVLPLLESWPQAIPILACQPCALYGCHLGLALALSSSCLASRCSAGCQGPAACLWAIALANS